LEYLAQHKEKTEFQKVTRKKNELPITAKGKEGKRILIGEFIETTVL
jgi:hypothetical protein